MKLSQLAKKLGLQATATEAQIDAALDTVVTRANEAAPVLTLLKTWDQKQVTAANVLELANVATIHPKLEMLAGQGCDAEKTLIKQLQDQIGGNGALVQKANEKVTAAETKLANETARANKAVADLLLANSKITLAETKASTAETNLANIKGSVAKAVVSRALADNKILFNEKTAKETELTNSADIATAAVTMLLGNAKLPTQSRVHNAGKRAAAIHDPNSCSAKVTELVNEKMTKEGMAYNDAWASVKKEQPALFTGMTNEVPKP